MMVEFLLKILLENCTLGNIPKILHYTIKLKTFKVIYYVYHDHIVDGTIVKKYFDAFYLQNERVPCM